MIDQWHPVAMGIDVGGTHIKGVVLSAEGQVLQSHHIPTLDDPAGHWRDRVREMAEALRDLHGSAIPAAGISAPGLANSDNTAIVQMPGRLSGLVGLVWSDWLGLPCSVLNDAHAALLAEAAYGAMSGFRHGVLLTLGTGVGGAIMIDGTLYQGQSQMAGHFGHAVLNAYDDEQSLLGMPGSLEYALGNYSVARRSRGRFLDTHALLDAFVRGDVFAQWLWLDMMRKLAIFISTLSNGLSPEVVCLAGGMTQASDHLLQPLESFLDIYEFRPDGVRTQLRIAKFADMAGAIGAARMAMKISSTINHDR
ncbi:MAG: ROK family protein [Bacteroidetes bacterium]|nr:ROK family protein [Bacteroidota bacterium]